jgi:flagellar biogenesis protein FliO
MGYSPPAEEKPAPTHAAVAVQEKKESFADSSDFCCYLLKIILGVVLILAVAYGLYRLRKRQESTKE